MNTLIVDLKDLLENHLSTLEDIFLNHEVHSKPKNVKVAVRTGDWKGALYYLQRYEYQKFIKMQVYYGACQAGHVALMKRFEIDENTKTEGLKYLAKGGHYQLIDQSLQHINYRKLILEGIVVSGNTEKIKEFISNNPDLRTHHLPEVYYKIGKHNLGLDLIDMLLRNFAPIPYEYIIGGLRRILGISKNNLFLIFDYNKIEAIYVHNFLIKNDNNIENLYDGMIQTFGMKGNTVKIWAMLSIFLGKFINMEDTVKVICKNFPYNTIQEIVDATIRIDNLDLFIKCHSSEPEKIEASIATAIDHNSTKILQYLFDNHIINELYFIPGGVNQLSDPRIARMYVQYMNKYNIRLVGLDIMYNCAIAHGCDVVADILANI